MMPQAWEKSQSVSDKMKDFYKYHAAIMEPWDGPALVCFTDGDGVGASLDRNGLRPCRYYITSENKLIVSSECGVFKNFSGSVVRKGRLSPGKMLWADFNQGRIIDDAELKGQLANANPYGEWMANEGLTMASLRAH